MATTQLVTAAKRAADYLNELSTGNRSFGGMYQDLSVGRQLREALESVDAPIDPAEHAAHALIDALTTLEQQIVIAPTLERLQFLKALAKRAYQHADLVDQKATAQRDILIERLR